LRVLTNAKAQSFRGGPSEKEADLLNRKNRPQINPPFFSLKRTVRRGGNGLPVMAPRPDKQGVAIDVVSAICAAVSQENGARWRDPRYQAQILY